MRESDYCGFQRADENGEEVLRQQLSQVRFIAARLHRRLPKHVALEDLIQEGTLGLIDAVGKYDPAHRTQFKTYAQFRIRGAMLDSLRDADWGSRKLRSDKRRLMATEARLCSARGSQPDESVLARELGISLAALHQLLRDVDNSRIDQLPKEEVSQADKGPSPLERLLRSESLGSVRKALFGLTEKEHYVIARHYFEEIKMKNIGKELNIGESRISQIHSSALKKLRDTLRRAACYSEME